MTERRCDCSPNRQGRDGLRSASGLTAQGPHGTLGRGPARPFASTKVRKPAAGSLGLFLALRSRHLQMPPSSAAGRKGGQAGPRAAGDMGSHSMEGCGVRRAKPRTERTLGSQTRSVLGVRRIGHSAASVRGPTAWPGLSRGTPRDPSAAPLQAGGPPGSPPPPTLLHAAELSRTACSALFGLLAAFLAGAAALVATRASQTGPGVAGSRLALPPGHLDRGHPRVPPCQRPVLKPAAAHRPSTAASSRPLVPPRQVLTRRPVLPQHGALLHLVTLCNT